MKTVVICNSNINDVIPEAKIYDYSFNNINVSVALLDVPEPDYSAFFNEKSVLIKVKAFSCNYRDKSLFLNFNNKCKQLSGSQKYFYSPFGSEFVGEVIKIGSSVTKLKKGDRVIPDMTYPLKDDGLFGGIPTNFASQRILLLRECELIKIPDCMSDEKAAAFSIAAQTVYSMIRKLTLKKGENVLITAATSNTSLAAIEALKYHDLNIYAVSSKSKVYEKRLLDLGVKLILPTVALTENELGKYIQEIKFDAVIDPFFDIYFCKIQSYMNINSRYVYCGLYNQHPSFNKSTIEDNPEKYISALINAIPYNCSIIANCLGSKIDINNAISDFSEQKYDVILDSVYTDDHIVEFIDKSFCAGRFGKVVYKYE